MKHSILLRAYMCAAMVVVTGVWSGCDLTSINQSPNAIPADDIKTAAGQYALLIGLQTTVADFYSSDRSRMTSIFTWQMCAPPGLGRPQPVQWNGYLMQPDGPIDDCWKAGYHTNTVADAILANAGSVTYGKGASDPQVINTILGMAYTYKALAFGELACLYGSIPIDISGLDAPPFATQQQAFDRTQALLDTAITRFNSGTASVASDLNFGGDKASWLGVAHSLKARYYLAVGDYQKALAEANQGIADPSGTVYGIYTTNSGEYSPWGHFSKDESGEPIRAEQTYIGLLQSEPGDSRLATYFHVNDSSRFSGYAAHIGEGESVTMGDDTFPTLGSTMNKYSGYGDPFPLISYEETVLIKAECEAQVGTLATAITDVNGIRSGAGLGPTAATTQAAVIAEILKQKDLQLFLEGVTYTDMRRTKTLPSSKVPVRFLYPVSEKNANPNVPADDPSLVNAIVH